MASIDSGRDPVNDLYDRACDLVEAATAMRRAAGCTDVARAAPAVVGCIETALDELNATCAALEAATHTAIRASSGELDGEWTDGHARMRSGFSHLNRALSEARDVAAAARTRASHALARAGIT